MLDVCGLVSLCGRFSLCIEVRVGQSFGRRGRLSLDTGGFSVHVAMLGCWAGTLGSVLFLRHVLIFLILFLWGERQGWLTFTCLKGLLDDLRGNGIAGLCCLTGLDAQIKEWSGVSM